MRSNNKKPSFDRVIIVAFTTALAAVCGGTVLADTIKKETSPAPSAVVDVTRSSAP